MNHEYFEHWSEEMAYYLGWLWADGNICDGKLQIGCCTEDEEILLNFMKNIGSPHAVQHLEGYWHKKGYYVKPYTKASVYSERMISSLVEKHGLIPRKTYCDPKLPSIKPKYVSHFVRGYYDGDGSIYQTNNNTSISIVGTQRFMTEFQTMIAQQTNLPYHLMWKNKKTKTSTAAWNIGWNAKAEVLTFLNFIYASNGPSLTRKKTLADVWRPELERYCKDCGVENRQGRIRLRFLSKRLGEYKSVEECMWARNYAHEKMKGYRYPIPSPQISLTRQEEIVHIVERKLAGDKTHQRKLVRMK